MNTPARPRLRPTALVGLLLLAGLLCANTASAQTVPSRLGNLDADGQPTVLDLVRLINHVNGAVPLSGPLLPYGDVNEDGAVNQADVDLIADAILGLGALPNPYAPPQIFTPITATNGTNLVISGTARPNRTVIVEGGGLRFEGRSDANGNFTINLALQPNRLNILYVSATNSAFTAGTPQTLRIIQDSQPPSLFIDFPADGSELISSNVVVAGRVGDMLSGFMGLNVTVTNLSVLNPPPSPSSGGPANVVVGIGNNGTFERSEVPLVVGTNLLVATARDVHGNALSRTNTVIRTVPTGLRMVAVSGDMQTTNIQRRLAQPILVRIESDTGTPFANKVVTFTATRSDGRLLPVDTNYLADDLLRHTDYSTNGVMSLLLLTDANGEARAWWTLGGDAGCGNNRVCATSRDIAGAAYFCASAKPASARQINIGSGNNQRAEAGGPLPEPLRAWVSDSCNGVESIPVTFRIVQGGGRLFPLPLGGGEGQGEGATSITNVTSRTGHAEVRFVLGPDAGNNVIEATFPGHPGSPATFTAYGLARDPARPTTFTGLVLDNSSQPIGGARCVLEVGGQHFTTLSDAHGQFRFDPSTLNPPLSTLPSGPAHLHLDGLPATSLGTNTIPAGSFPALSYSMTVVPNAENSLPMPVLLPRLNPANARVYYGTNDLVLTCEGMAGLKMFVKAGSMRRADGSIPTPQDPAIIALNQVHHDDVPMPMPDGAAPPFAWTLQPGGAHFDPPITIEYPNMSGLPAGGIAYFLSFNHDTERFEIIASGHVKDDGATIVTDPGVGLSIAGWGCNCPPYSVTTECKCEDDPAVKDQIRALKAQQRAAMRRARSFVSQAGSIVPGIFSETGNPPLLEISTKLAALKLSYDVMLINFYALRQTYGYARVFCLVAIPEPTPFGELACAALAVATTAEFVTFLGALGATAYFAYDLYDDIDRAIKAVQVIDLLSRAAGEAATAAAIAAQIRSICAALALSEAADTAARNLQQKASRAIGQVQRLAAEAQRAAGELGPITNSLNSIKRTVDGWVDELRRFINPSPSPAFVPAQQPRIVTITLPNGFQFNVELPPGVEPDGTFAQPRPPDPDVVQTNNVEIAAATNSIAALASISLAVSNEQSILIIADDAFKASLQELDNVLDFRNCTISVNGQSVVLNDDGTFSIPNVAAQDLFGPGGPGTAPDFLSDDFLRLVGVCTTSQGMKWFFSEPFQTRRGQPAVITNLTFTDFPPPLPESIRVAPDNPTLTALGQTTQVRVTATLHDGSTVDVTPRSRWTVYRTSNPNVATVDQDGLVTARAKGMVFITAVNEGATSVCQIDVAPGDPFTTVFGYVHTTNGTPIAGATINVLGLAAASVTSAADGSFVITNVPTAFGPFRVAARLVTTTALFGTSGVLDPVPGGITDAGILTLKQGVAWIGGVSGVWHGATNWSTGQVPGPTNDVYISAPPGVTVTISQGNNVVNTLLIDTPLRLTAGTLRANGIIQANTPLILAGGTLVGSTVIAGSTQPAILATASGGFLDGVTVNGDLDLTGGGVVRVLAGGLALNGTAQLNNSGLLAFEGTQTFGAGTVVFAGNSGQMSIEGNNVALTLGPAVVVRGRAGTIGGQRFIGGAHTLINQGLISADVAGGTLTINTTTLTNTGTMQATNGGTLTINSGSWSSSGALIGLDGSALNLNGSWSNSGTLNVTNMTLRLNGSFSLPGLGTFNRSGGVVYLNSTLNLAGGTLALNPATGSWVLDGGTVRNGTVSQSGGAALLYTGNANNYLDGVTVNGDLDLTGANAVARVLNGLVLNGTAQINNNGILAFEGTQTFGAGTVVFAGNSGQMSIEGNNVALTLGPAVVVRGRAGTIGGQRFIGGAHTLINQGLISADVAGGTLTINTTTLTNTGTMQATNGGTLTINSGSWSSSGALIGLDGSALNLNGSWSNSGTLNVTNMTLRLNGSFSLPGLGTFNRSGGVVYLNSTLNLAGGTLALNPATGSWVLDGGTVRNGTVSQSGGAALLYTGNANNYLDGVTVNGDLDLTGANAVARVLNGLVLNGTAQINNNGILAFEGTQTFGAGTVVFAGNSGQMSIEGNNVALTLGPAVVVRGRAGTIGGQRFIGGAHTLINQGLISADVAGGTLTVSATSFINQGTTNELNGGRLIIQ